MRIKKVNVIANKIANIGVEYQRPFTNIKNISETSIDRCGTPQITFLYPVFLVVFWLAIYCFLFFLSNFDEALSCCILIQSEIIFLVGYYDLPCQMLLLG